LKLGTCLFICQGTSARRQRSDLFGLQVKQPPVTTYLTTQRKRHLVKCLAQGHIKKTYRPFLHTILFLCWTSSKEAV